ncbi:hypothetical protein [uncultured Lutibacter sp.]|uniref:hypothetical protein n=1 Tax=uncultured Lutibacter sp. TaxID=437739 RepID=UPI0026072913|nr:hypothetical protein [uncultured Lutibacter sp.]
MNYKEEIENFVVIGFKKNNIQLITDNKHNFVLKNETENFITKPPKDFKYHRWAGSLKSSQAFAYNVFSGINKPTLKFEFPMEAFDRAAQIDVMFEDLNSQTIELFEVKAFEINNLGVNKIMFEDKYFTKTEYKRSDIAELFIDFLNTVIKNFENQKIYGSGIKQLCSHLLGIINTMDKPYYANKKFKLYSFCLDNPFSNKFEQNINNYKVTLSSFKDLVDKFLIDIKVNERVEYCGFLSASEYINKNVKLLGKENYDYVIKRYFF